MQSNSQHKANSKCVYFPINICNFATYLMGVPFMAPPIICFIPSKPAGKILCYVVVHEMLAVFKWRNILLHVNLTGIAVKPKTRSMSSTKCNGFV